LERVPLVFWSLSVQFVRYAGAALHDGWCPYCAKRLVGWCFAPILLLVRGGG
jgi:hypothetical protein